MAQNFAMFRAESHRQCQHYRPVTFDIACACETATSLGCKALTLLPFGAYFEISPRILTSRIMSALAIFSIVLMIIENELTFVRLENEVTKAAWFLRLIITVSTAVLLALILYYHHVDMTLYAFRNRLEDWRVQLTLKKILLIATELVVCAIHPVPRSYPSTDPPRTEPNSYPLSYMPVDVALSLPSKLDLFPLARNVHSFCVVFLRLYLLGRSFMIHSPLVRNVPMRALGYLNHVPIDAYFLFKTYIEKYPTRCLTSSCIVVFLIGSWALRACDYKPTGEHMLMTDAMWLFIITSTTVGLCLPRDSSIEISVFCRLWRPLSFDILWTK